MQQDKNPIHSEIDNCISLGDRAFRDVHLEEAAEHFERACQLFKSIGQTDNPALRHCLRTLCETCSMLGRVDEALKNIQALRQLDDSTENRRTYVTLLSKGATALENEGQKARAAEAYRTALIAASDLLPMQDPLISRLNSACIEVQKNAPKTQAMENLDRQLLLNNKTSAQTFDAKRKQSIQSNISENRGNARTAAQLDQSPYKALRKYSGQSQTQRFLNSNILSMGLSFILIACVMKAALFIPDQKEAVKSDQILQTLQGEEFESCDKRDKFSIGKNNLCTIKSANFDSESPYTIIDNKWPSIDVLLRGYLKRNELWYLVSENGITDPDNTLLYKSNAPEMAVVKKMWWYADFAQKWYHDHHSYPINTEDCLAHDPDFKFINAFTKKEDNAAVVFVKGVNGDPGWYLRPQNHFDTPLWRAGGIHCICVDKKRFYVHGCDGKGNPLTASDAKLYFVIECNEGSNLTRVKMLKASEQAASTTNTARPNIFIYFRPDQRLTVAYFRSVSCGLTWIFFILTIGLCFSMFKLKKSSLIKSISFGAVILSAAFVGLWYWLAYN